MKEYLQMIIWMLIFVLIIEMIFPDSAYRKYIKLILGCILVYTLARPIIGIFNTDEKSYDSYVKYYQIYLNGKDEGIEIYEDQKENQEAILKEYYKKGISELVEKNFEVEVIYVNIRCDDNILSRIDLVASEKIGEDIKIGTIKIGDKSDTLGGDINNLKNKIKTCLSDFYNVQVRNIYITVHKS